MKKITLISDFGCPYCFRQHLAFQQLVEKNIPFELEPIAYMLRPETPMDGRIFSDEEIRSYRKKLKDLEEKDPLFKEVHFAPLTYTYNTYLAHLCSQGAKKAGKYLPFALLVYRAYFEEGKNISSIDELFALLSKIGLDPKTTMESVHADTMRLQIHKGFTLTKKHHIKTVPALYIEEENRMIAHSTSTEELEEIVI